LGLLPEKLQINGTFFTGIRDGIGSIETRLRDESPRHHFWIPNSCNDFTFPPPSTPARNTTQPFALWV